MARLFHDLIVAEADGKPRLTLRRRDGSAALEDVAVEIASRVEQPGDAWGALHANLLLEQDANGVPTPRTDNPHGVNWQQTGAAPAQGEAPGLTAGRARKADSATRADSAARADDAAKLGGKTLSLRSSGDTLYIDWR